MKIIVLTITPYKEKDAIINAISEKESLTFLARGIKNPKSKNVALNTPLTVADIELMDGDFKHPILKSSKPISTSLKMEMDTHYLGSLLLIDEIMVNLFPEEDRYLMFSSLEKALDNIKNSGDWLMTLLIFMNHALTMGGFQLEANQCVMCGKKRDIVAFSFNDGGFICKDCFTDTIERDLNKTQMLLLRRIINNREYDIAIKDYNQEDAELLLQKFIDHLQEAFGYNFKNLRLLTSEK